MRLQTVFTRRRERISSDEEERRRAGFDLLTAYEFSSHGARSGRQDAHVTDSSGAAVAHLTYGDTATIRIINLGRRRRGDNEPDGFWLDIGQGRWLSDRAATADTTPEDTELFADTNRGAEDVQLKRRVIPYVEDRRNILLFRCAQPVDERTAASLQYALERGIEAVFQLEDAELTSESLPDADGRGRILLTESAEGGAGVLRQLQDVPGALAAVAAEALRLCHFHPETGADLNRAEGARERCELACYDCLLSYSNQARHSLVNRHTVRDLLLTLSRTTTVHAGSGGDRGGSVQELSARTDSGLERDWLAWVETGGFRLPDGAQPLIDTGGRKVRPDFVYRRPDGDTAVFVDGPHHEDRNRSERDQRAEDALWEAGWNVVRFRHDQREAGAGLPSPTVTRRSSGPLVPAPGDTNTASSTPHPAPIRCGPGPAQPQEDKSVTTTAAAVPSAYAPGTLVTARGREWVVLPGSAADFLLLRPLGGDDDTIAGVLPALESVAPASFAPPTTADLGNQLSAGLLRTALRIGFRAAAGPLRSLAGIAVEPRQYQLVPLLLAMRQDTVRLLIADDVGIGKTVEAGLVVKELLEQGEANGLAVLCSPALAEQWQDELRNKFGIEAELVLPSTAKRLERGLPIGQSLFDRYPHVVISTDFIKSPKRRDAFVRSAPDLVVVDEAHTCVSDGSGTTDKQQKQQRYALLQRLAADPGRHLLLVTATPHSGKEEGFRNLIGLLDPALADVDLEQSKGRDLLARHMVQRRRHDIRRFLDQETPFPRDRQTKEAPYRLSPDYSELMRQVLEYARESVQGTDGELRPGSVGGPPSPCSAHSPRRRARPPPRSGAVAARSLPRACRKSRPWAAPLSWTSPTTTPWKASTPPLAVTPVWSRPSAAACAPWPTGPTRWKGARTSSSPPSSKRSRASSPTGTTRSSSAVSFTPPSTSPSTFRPL